MDKKKYESNEMVKWGGLLNEFLWICSGVNRKILRQCPTDYAKYAGIGGTILFTALMAMLSGGYAMFTVFKNPTMSIVLGVFWGLLIFNLDRFIVNTMYSDGLVTISWREFYSGLPRIIMAIFLGIVISTPLELKIYEDGIDNEIEAMVTEIDPDKQRISLSVRRLLRNPWKEFAEANKIENYVTDDAGLFKVLQDQIIGKFGERNAIVNQARSDGKDIAEALKDHKRIIILINDYVSFIETVYSEDYGMSGFFETALEKGRDHKIQFVAAMTGDDVSDCARYQVSRQFTSMEGGVNLGGLFDQQNILHWELSSADAVRQLPPGFGYALTENGTPVKVLTPLV